jgi:integrase
MPNPHNERERFLSKKEAKRLISYCPPTIRPFIQAALFTGMRRGELLQMEWSWVDLKNRMITIPPTATKTGRRRHVPISDNMHQVLKDLRVQSVEGA